MKISIATSFAALVFLGLAAQAQEPVEPRIHIAVDDGAGPIAIDLGGENAFDPADLQVGESRSIVDEDGRNVLFTRTAEGMQVSVDGRTIELPPMHGPHPGPHPGPHDGNMDIRVMRMHGPGGPADDAITIISGKPLDDAVKETIRSTLVSAGETREVVFIDESAAVDHPMMMHGGEGKMIKIISQDVTTTN